MKPSELRNLTNRFQDVRLISLRTWAAVLDMTPCDHGGPYVVTQEGYDPDDLSVTANEFVLGRSGVWTTLTHFFHLAAPLRREEYIFGTAGEVMRLMEGLPTRPAFLRPEAPAESAPPGDWEELSAAFQVGKSVPPSA